MKATDRNRPASTLGSSKVSIRPGAGFRWQKIRQHQAVCYVMWLQNAEGARRAGVYLWVRDDLNRQSAAMRVAEARRRVWRFDAEMAAIELQRNARDAKAPPDTAQRLAMTVKTLAGALLRADPDNRLPQRAMEFLRTLGLLEGVMTQGVTGSQGKEP